MAGSLKTCVEEFRYMSCRISFVWPTAAQIHSLFIFIYFSSPRRRNSIPLLCVYRAHFTFSTRSLSHSLSVSLPFYHSLAHAHWSQPYIYIFLFYFSFSKIIGLLSLWTSTWCDCDTEMCQHNHNTTNTYNGNDFFCSSLFTQRKSTHYQRKNNKHSIASATSTRPTKSIASIGMSVFFLASFFFYILSRLLLLYGLTCLSGGVLFAFASLHLFYFSHFSFSMCPNWHFSFRFYCPPPILCLLFTEDMRVVQTDQRSVHRRTKYKAQCTEKNTNKVIYIQILCGFLRVFKSSEYRSQTSQRTNTHTTYRIHQWDVCICIRFSAGSRTRADCIRYETLVTRNGAEWHTTKLNQQKLQVDLDLFDYSLLLLLLLLFVYIYIRFFSSSFLASSASLSRREWCRLRWHFISMPLYVIAINVIATVTLRIMTLDIVVRIVCFKLLFFILYFPHAPCVRCKSLFRYVFMSLRVQSAIQSDFSLHRTNEYISSLYVCVSFFSMRSGSGLFIWWNHISLSQIWMTHYPSVSKMISTYPTRASIIQ